MNTCFRLFTSAFVLLIPAKTVSLETKTAIVGPCFVLKNPPECSDDYIQVYLYTRQTEDEFESVKLSTTLDSLNDTHFNPLHPSKVFLHGFMGDSELCIYFKKLYLRKGDYNIWIIDYPKLTTGPEGLIKMAMCYANVVIYNAPYIGHCLAPLIAAIQRQSSAPVHVVGLSLGSHVANYIANRLRESGSRKLDRITGLDPPGLIYNYRRTRHRLDPGDADFVDVVHTDGIVLGSIKRFGHVDFYMNGGLRQPCCHESQWLMNAVCNHMSSAEYFAESIDTPKGFLAYPCKHFLIIMMGMCQLKETPILMGEDCPPGSRGVYVVYTADRSPYALGKGK